MQQEDTYNYEPIRNKIVGAGLKATQQRIVVYDALVSLMNHPSAENIYEKVKPANPSISLGTVYKTLDTFVSVGLAHKVATDEGHMRYDPNVDYHNHIYCTNTKEIIDYDSEDLNRVISEFFSKQNIQNLNIKDIRLQINGEKINPEKDISINK